MRTEFRLFLAGAALAVAAPVSAANLALVLDAGGEDEAAIGALGDALNAGGYEVYERREAARSDMRQALSALAARLDEAERVILVFAGPVREAGGTVWLLPSGASGASLVDAAFAGVSLDVLLALAGELPGRSAVVLARSEGGEEVEEGAGDAAGAEGDAARPDVPQGVLYLDGPRGAALEAVTARLLTGETTAAAALDGIEGVTVAGFASPDAGFGAPDAAAPPPPLPSPTAELSPAERAEATEAALGLDNAARRGVQGDLNVLGYGTRGIDGIFGPGTRSAIASWQADQGFARTGYLDAEQLARLREAGAARSAELAAEAERARAAEEAADAEFWRTTGAGGSQADLRAYLARYPNGIYAEQARAGLAAFEAEARAEAEGADRAAWEQAEGRGTVRAYRRYLEERPQGAFAEQAAARIAALEDAPRAEARRAEAEAREAGLGLNQASRAVIESQLAALGYDVGNADGEFDDATRSALRSFQSDRGVEATGYVDQATVQALIVASLGLR